MRDHCDALMLYRRFMRRTEFACVVCVWIRYWNGPNIMQSCDFISIKNVNKDFWLFYTNVMIDDVLLYWRAVDVRTFHQEHCVFLSGRCLDPVRECRKQLLCSGEVPLFIMLMIIIDVFDECHDWWCIVILTCCWCEDLSSGALCVHVVHVYGSGDGMSQTVIMLRGGCRYSWCWWA